MAYSGNREESGEVEVIPEGPEGPMHTDIPELMCNPNGEIEVSLILNTINRLINKGNFLEDCCDMIRGRQNIRTLREGHTLYITDDGTPPKT